MFTALMVLSVLFLASMFIPDFKLTLKSVGFTVLAMALIFSFDSFAQEIVEDPTHVPEWLSQILNWLVTIPKVGPIVVEIGKWLGVIASVFTVLSVALTAIVKIPEIGLRFFKFVELAEKLAKFHDKIQPYIKYLSIFNVKKK